MPYEIRVPRLGWSMEEGTFVRWLKQSGEAVAVGDLLFEIEGDKAVQEIESVDAGVLYVPEDAPQPGSVVLVGALLGYVLAPGELPPATPQDRSGPPIAAPTPPANGDSAAAPAAGPAVRRLARKLGVDLGDVLPTGKSGRISRSDVELYAEAQQLAAGVVRQQSPARLVPSTARAIATPRAKRVAGELGIDWTGLQGTGRDGRIREADVLRARREPIIASTPSQPAGRLSPRRKAIAQRLRAARDHVVPVTLTTVADATNLGALREQFKSHPSGIVPTYADLVACLVARVLMRHPELAVVWSEDHGALLPMTGAIHVGIAVDTPAGLLVPVLRDVLARPLASIALESRELIERARAGRLKSADVDGGAITISNLGAYGIDAFTPVINPPQIAILGLGAIRREPVVLADDRIAPRDRVTLSLTFDHAAVDGAPAAAFLRDVVGALENAAAWLLSQ
jgi:pyruvate dehydrogenase E2 component (dihydrolipoamide acetyltransferase)